MRITEAVVVDAGVLDTWFTGTRQMGNAPQPQPQQNDTASRLISPPPLFHCRNVVHSSPHLLRITLRCARYVAYHQQWQKLSAL
jgi:hypothetical protein